MSQPDEFTIDGRRVLQSINIGSGLVQEIENTLGSFWVCTSCGVNHCAHIKQFAKGTTSSAQGLVTALLAHVRRKLVLSSKISNQTTNAKGEVQ